MARAFRTLPIQLSSQKVLPPVTWNVLQTVALYRCDLQTKTCSSSSDWYPSTVTNTCENNLNRRNSPWIIYFLQLLLVPGAVRGVTPDASTSYRYSHSARTQCRDYKRTYIVPSAILEGSWNTCSTQHAPGNGFDPSDKSHHMAHGLVASITQFQNHGCSATSRGHGFGCVNI